MALHFTHQHLLWLRSVNYFMQCLHAFSTGLKLAMKFFFFFFSFFYYLQPGSGIHEIKPRGYRTIGQDQEVLDSNDIPHIVICCMAKGVPRHPPFSDPAKLRTRHRNRHSDVRGVTPFIIFPAFLFI